MAKKYANSLDERAEKCYYSNMENSIEINQKIAKNLTHYRKTAGYTQAELAEKIKYSDKSVSKWESGNGVPDIYTLIQLAELYGVTVDTLLGDGAPVRAKKYTKSLRVAIMMLCSGIVWLVTTCFFVMMQLFFPGRAWWISFLYGGLINGIVLLVFASIWKYKTVGFLAISLIIWLSCTCLCLTIKVVSERQGIVDIGPAWSVFLLGIPLQVLEIWWVFFRTIAKRNKKIIVVPDEEKKD